MKDKKNLKKLSFNCALFIAVALLTVSFFALMLPAYKKAEDTGILLGAASGKEVGKFTGSYKGITDGVAEGKKQGLKAEDISSKITGTMKETSKLEVLSAGIKISDMHEVGEKYKSLYIIKGIAVFTVDLNKATVANTDDEIIITIPQPEAEIFIDEKETQKIAEQSNLIFDGSSKDGYTEYISSMNTISKDISSRINEYDNLIEEARRNARNHIERIAYSMCGNSFSYSVKFSSESGGENNE